MEPLMLSVVLFLVSLLVSAVIIHIVTTLFGETEKFGTAILAALVGSSIYAIAYVFLGSGLLAALAGGIVWLIALRSLYKMGRFKTLGIAIIVWMAAAAIGWFLPTVFGPL